MNIIEISLSRNHVALVDEEDAAILTLYKWYSQSVGNGFFYAARREGSARQPGSKILLMHRVIMDPPEDYYLVDHRNGNTLDNRRCNLRICTKQENQRNQKKTKNSSSKFKGVSWSRKEMKWVASITVDYKSIRLGCYNDEAEAAQVYIDAADKYFKEYAYGRY